MEPAELKNHRRQQDEAVMKSRSILTVALLSFVAVSVVVLIVQEVQWASRSAASASGPAGKEPRPAAATAAGLARPVDLGTSTPDACGNRPQAEADKVVVYCFHKTARCDTCDKIEAYTKEALQTGFAEQLQSGSVQLHVVDYEQAEHGHFREDFQLIGASVVLARLRGGKTADWDNLLDLDPLLEHEALFIQGVQKRLKAFLTENPSRDFAPQPNPADAAGGR